MAIIDDFKLGKNVDARVRDMLSQITDILNNDGYQRKVYANSPSKSDPGFQGEKRIVITGTVLRLFLYASSQWWKSDATQTTGWSAVS